MRYKVHVFNFSRVLNFAVLSIGIKFRQYEFASAEILEQIHTVSIFRKPRFKNSSDHLTQILFN